MRNVEEVAGILNTHEGANTAISNLEEFRFEIARCTDKDQREEMLRSYADAVEQLMCGITQGSIEHVRKVLENETQVSANNRVKYAEALIRFMETADVLVQQATAGEEVISVTVVTNAHSVS